ncbi:hypothetical protein ACFTAO_20390 [Paenibacillus rhizoplanae]
MISGRMLYESIDKEYLDDKVPVHILQDDENLLYRELFRLLVTEPGLDISRIYVDYAYIIESFSEFQQYLTHEGKPVDCGDLSERVETMLENHISLWEDKKNRSVHHGVRPLCSGTPEARRQIYLNPAHFGER